MSTPDPSAPRVRRRRAALPVALIGLAVLLVGGLGAVSLYAVRVDQAVNTNLDRTLDMPAEEPTEGTSSGRPARPRKKQADTAVDVVLMGSDSRTPGVAGAGRSDVLMLLHLSGDRSSAYLISFPRDMWVTVPGHGKNKINAAYAFGGPQLAVRTLETLLDVRMDHLAVVDFDGFVRLTNDLGGVQVDNPHRSVSQGWEFPVGWISIRGEQALAYVRERKQLPRGDLDRAERQRLVMQAIIKKGINREVIGDPSRFLTFAGHVASNVAVDRGLTPAQLRKLALSLRLTPDDVHLLQAPISGFGTSPDKQSIDVVDTRRLADLATALREDTVGDYLARHPEG